MILSDFQNLRDKDLRKTGVCIGEGPAVVERMVQAGWNVRRILCTERMASRVQGFAEDIPVAVVSETEIRGITGFPFHRGVMALAERPAELPLQEFLSPCGPPLLAPRFLVYCPWINDPENLGSIIRSAAAFGAAAVVVGPGGADPYSRRVIRVSMGGIFSVPVAFASEFNIAAGALREAGYAIVSTAVSDRCLPIATFRWPAKSAIVLGDEYNGLDEAYIKESDFSVTIPINLKTDSLNVGVAAGICMYACAVSSKGEK